MAPNVPFHVPTNHKDGLQKEAVIYESLSTDNIRILRLKPLAYNRTQGISETTIHCDLVTVDLRHSPRYNAISYAWGSGEYDQEIMIRGRPYSISANLAKALQHIRHEIEEISLWADQLCINQKDDNEKNHQVQMMKLIYENASKTIVWLGSSADNSDLVMVTFGVLAKWSTAAETQTALIVSEVAKRMSDISKTVWCARGVISGIQIAFDKFCNRTYWKRLWVIQEFAVCSELVLKCGRLDIRGEDFILAWAKVRRLSSKHRFQVDRLGAALSSTAKSFVSGLVTGRETYRTDPSSLLGVMITNLMLEEDYNHPQCSDPRDRVFSLLGLARDVNSYRQFPDYTKPTEEIYEEFARALLRRGIIDILSYSQVPRNFSSLPSWVPDWSMPVRIPAGMNQNFATHPDATRRTDRTKVLILDRRSVVLVGTFVDTIAAVGAEWNPNWLEPLKPEEALPYLKGVEQFCVSSPRILGRDTKLASARIAVSYCGGARGSLWDNLLEHYEAAFACFARGERLPRYLDEDSDVGAADDLTKASKYAVELNRLHSRRVIITDSGYVGLAPSHAMKGDRVCLFLHAGAPYIIRPGPNESHTLIGDGFIYGIMRGEFFRDNPVLEAVKLV